ncbi:MAG: type 1 glutamine amidotransferase [Acidobacteriaceae bacterium]|nr:type 1 glutamine amidotransferase [Acidobacteriaceae bacterium]
MAVTPAVLIFIEDGFEDMEVMYPKYRLQEAGYTVVVAGPDANRLYAGKHGYPCVSDASIFEIQENDFCGLICPGGWAPDKLRRIAEVKSLTAQFSDAGKLVAAICHGGWVPISAGVYRCVRVTGSLGIKDDLVNAGAIFEDAPVVVDHNFVSSRKPDDLPVFMHAALEVLAASKESAVTV